MAAKIKFSPSNADDDPTTKVRKGEGSSDILKIDVNSLERMSFPNFKRPNEIATFSTKNREPNLDNQEEETNSVTKYAVRKCCSRTLTNDCAANLMVLVEPSPLHRVKFDLNCGYGTQIAKDRDNEHLNILLECLKRERLIGRSEFVCWRGLLTKVSASPYDSGGKFDDGLKVVVQRINGVFYMYEFPTEEALKKEEHLDERQKRMQYWGMKFESYVTAKPGGEPSPNEPMDFNLEFGSVVETKLGSHSLIFGGEVDCCFANARKQYVELKTTREWDHPNQERSFRRFKLLKWWLQSFLIGIDNILVGFRDDDGVARRCKWFRVSDIPAILKQDYKQSKPSACLSFLDSFLHFVKGKVVIDFKPYVFTRPPFEKEFSAEVDEAGDYKFLPNWFITRAVR